MKITKDTVVSLRFKVAEASGKLIEESREPMVYLHGGYQNTLPKIEAALDGQEPGFECTLQLQPEDAFGQRDESLVRVIPKSEFPPGVKVGGQLEGRTDDGQPRVFHVMKIKGPEVHLDGTRLRRVWAASACVRWRCSASNARSASSAMVGLQSWRRDCILGKGDAGPASGPAVVAVGRGAKLAWEIRLPADSLKEQEG